MHVSAPGIVFPAELANLMTICTFVHSYKMMIHGYRAEQSCVALGKIVLQCDFIFLVCNISRLD